MQLLQPLLEIILASGFSISADLKAADKLAEETRQALVILMVTKE